MRSSTRELARRLATAASGPFEASKTALVLIEFQNNFCTPGGGSYGGPKDELERLDVIANATSLLAEARAKGVMVVHAPITYNDDFSDLPPRDFGIMAGAADRGGFVRSDWDGAIIDALAPIEGETVLQKKTGLDAFAHESELSEALESKGIEAIAVGGLLTNCCVESTIRHGYELGYTQVVVRDCTAALDEISYSNSLGADGSLNFFSTPMTKDEFLEKVVV